MHWSWSPVGNYQSRYAVGECLSWAGQQSWKLIDSECMTSPAHTQLVAHNLAFLIILTNTLWDKGSLMLGSKPPGQRSMLHILSFLPRVKGICQEWMAVLSSLPAGLSACGPRVSAQAWVSASALCLSAPLQCPPAGYVSGPDRLPDSGIYLGEQGKGHRVIPHAGCDKPLRFSFLYHWSCLPFMMTATRDSTLPVTLVLQGHSTITPCYHIPGKRQTPR